MPKQRTLFVAPALCLSLVIAGCGDDPVGLVGDPLSQAEIQAVFSAISGAFANVNQGSAQAPSGPSLVPVEIDQTFDMATECPAGGAIALSGWMRGMVDDETLASDIDFDLTLAPDGCVVVAPEATITVDGDPNIVIDISTFFNDTQYSMSGTYSGGFSFTTSDGRSGACGINVGFSATANLESQTGESTVTGYICNVDADAFVVMGAS